jgi:uncharacterized protein (TIGR00369 family)
MVTGARAGPLPRRCVTVEPLPVRQNGSFARSEGEADVDNRNPHREFGLVSPVAGRVSGLNSCSAFSTPPIRRRPSVRSPRSGRSRWRSAAWRSRRRPRPASTIPWGWSMAAWLALLLDTAMGCAVHSTLEPGQAFTTVEMKTTFVRPVRESTGKLRCEGVLLHAGSRIASSEGKIFDGPGRLVAHGSETCLISTIRSARGAAAPPMQAARSPTTRRA